MASGRKLGSVGSRCQCHAALVRLCRAIDYEYCLSISLYGTLAVTMQATARSNSSSDAGACLKQ